MFHEASHVVHREENVDHVILPDPNRLHRIELFEEVEVIAINLLLEQRRLHVRVWRCENWLIVLLLNFCEPPVESLVTEVV